MTELSVARTIIEPRKGILNIRFQELWAYRELFLFLVWRDIKVRYAQSVLGIGWAVIQPVFSMIVFTIVFGNLAKLESDGQPYQVFSLAGLTLWSYFSTTLTDASGSLVKNANMIQKIYFPRLIVPVASVLGKLVDFFLVFLVLLGLMAYYGIFPGAEAIVMVPFLVFMTMMTTAGAGMWLSSLAIQYRDINYGLHFGIQLLMYAAPVVYPLSYVPSQYRLLYGLNPMVGIIEGFRVTLLRTGPMPWDLIALAFVVSLGLLASGAMYFRNKERVFADVV